jgi:transcriptional regulator with XRE-family HTH domain
MQITDRLQQRRREKKSSLTALAIKAGISKGYLHAIETGKTLHPSADVMQRLANALGTTIGDLLGEEIMTPEGDIPPTLWEFASTSGLAEADVRMLANIHYRGKRPERVEDWWFIFEAIKRTLG